MNSEIVIAIKDSVKLNILHEVLSNNISLSFQLNNGNDENYSSQIHNEKSRVKVYGKYNISEDPTGEFLTIRPVAPDCKMTIKASVPVGVNGKKISVVRSSTREIEKEFEITPDVASIEFIPCGKQGYTFRVTYGDLYVGQRNSETDNIDRYTQANDFLFSEQNERENDNRFDSTPVQQSGVSDSRFASFDIRNDSVISTTQIEPVDNRFSQPAGVLGNNETDILTRTSITEQTDNELESIENRIYGVERDQSRLAQKKQRAIEHLEKIETEYKKDYASLEQELEEIKSRMSADVSIVEHYKDQDVVSVEVIFQEVKQKLEEAESQIRLFIEAKQRKTMEIEGEIKSNKK